MERVCLLCLQTYIAPSLADTKKLCPLCYLRCHATTTWPWSSKISYASRSAQMGFIYYPASDDTEIIVYFNHALLPGQIRNSVASCGKTTTRHATVHYY